MAERPAMVLDEAALVFFSDAGEVPLRIGERLNLRLARLEAADGNSPEGPALKPGEVFVDIVAEVDHFSIDKDARATVQLERDDEAVVVYVDTATKEDLEPSIRYRGSGSDLATDCLRVLGEDVTEIARFLDEIHTRVDVVQRGLSTVPRDLALRDALQRERPVS